jgi:hypothetical protein
VIARGVFVAVLSFASIVSAQSIRVDVLRGDRGGRVRAALVERLSAARDGDADVIISGRVRGRRASLEITRDGEVERVRASGRPSAIADRVAGLLSEPIVLPEQINVPPPPRDVPRVAAPGRTSIAPNVPRGAWQDAPRAFELGAHFALFSRRLTYTDDLRGRLADFEIMPAPRVAASFAWFPLRHATSELYAGFGIAAEARTAFLLESSNGQGVASIPTRSWGYDIELRYELPFDRHFVGASIGYGEEVFASDLPPPPPGGRVRPSIVPMHYSYLRPAIAADFRLHDLFSAGASFGWRSLLSTGGLDERYGLPRSESGGFDAGVTLTAHLAWYLELRLRAEYHRYFFSFDPEPGDYYVVGGAMDEWASIGLEIATTLPGTL